jgi:hypothetical protein
MGLSHCPLCIALAVLSVVRAAAHLILVGLSLLPGPQGRPIIGSGQQGLQALQLGFTLGPFRRQSPQQRHRPIAC